MRERVLKKITFVVVFTCIFTTLIFAQKNVTSLQDLEKNKEKIYSKRDNVLYYLDSGMLAYYENDFSGAIERLSKAEQFIDDYYTKSVTQNMAAFLTNDTAIEYPGEDYEDIYINLIKTIAYYKAGKWEEGFHELNAYRRKTNLLKQKYQNDINRVKEYAKISDNANVNLNFYDSALAEYLYLLYYRNIKDYNQMQYEKLSIVVD